MLTRSGHDYEPLCQRWRELAQANGWACSVLAEAGGYPILQIDHVPENGARTSRSLHPDPSSIYLSAGVHGDECAPVWGLLFWVEQHAKWLSRRPFLLFPCLNPAGLVHNTRHDQDGTDLNRIFHDSSHPVIRSWQAAMAGRSFSQSICLHEDYDATGIYLYELSRQTSRGEGLIRSCEDLIPRERDGLVDGREFISAVRHAVEDEILMIVGEELQGGVPEAIYLFLNHAATSFTFESPSEFDLARRIAVHRRFLDVVTNPGYLGDGSER
jgi:hypothetical protein